MLLLPLPPACTGLRALSVLFFSRPLLTDHHSCGSLTRTRFRSQMKPLSLLSPNINTKGSTIGLTPATCRAASRSSSASTLGCRVLNALLSAC